MGAWGTGSFENDGALDWLAELEHSDGFNAITEALAFVANLDLDEFLEVDEAARAVAASEVVAALQGQPAFDLPEQVQTWLAAHSALSTHDPVPLALKAAARVRGDSEMKELWDETEDAAEWYGKMDNLLARLGNTD